MSAIRLLSVATAVALVALVSGVPTPRLPTRVEAPAEVAKRAAVAYAPLDEEHGSQVAINNERNVTITVVVTNLDTNERQLHTLEGSHYTWLDVKRGNFSIAELGAATSADISFNVRPGTDLFSINLERGFDTVFGFDFWGKRPNVSCLTADCADGHRRKGDGKVFKAEHGSTYFVSIYETRD